MISEKEIIQWHRARAAFHSSVADWMEQRNGAPMPLRTSDVTIEEIVNSFGKLGSNRCLTIAQKLGTSEHEIRQIIKANPDIFVVGDRGWVRKRADSTDPVDATAKPNQGLCGQPHLKPNTASLSTS